MFLLAAVVICGCAPNAAYRTRMAPTGEPCDLASAACDSDVWQRLPPASSPGLPASRHPVGLGFVEFDDQGQLRHPELKNALMARVRAEADAHPLLIVVFAHGWKHNAAASDSNVVDFGRLLQRIAVEDEKACAGHSCADRQVVGVFLGWRGLSASVEPFKELSFWTRKDRAQRVGSDGAMEVLAELKKIEGGNDLGRMIIVGHSFGGALIYTAIQQQLMRDTWYLNRGSMARNAADLIVLVNPAFEAARFHALNRRAAGMTHPDSQRPILAVFTSRNDTATGRAFPVGRTLGTLFQSHTSDEQRRENRTALGHYTLFQTHDLNLTTAAGTDTQALLRLSTYSEYGCAWQAYQAGTTDAWSLGELALSRRPTMQTDGQRRNPFYVVSVDPGIIDAHNGIWGDRFSQFLYRFVAVQSWREVPGCDG
ncbi:alpha/beta hydrolase [Lysobacter sp. S4-A87]|uniref:alpha/beta hydrolase n=1 Tax=Lysobacter sp. S4-A87 TaxID=2925843 RepID=UPI001F53DBC6|nr:alpha/beta hydrolase [Lysobacter sp. S4-A87]UNK48743.1 alpha/beta hydrolase [Lysobacter sp. S4-A87]